MRILYTSGEIDYCHSLQDPKRSYALCFAFKEAVAKALGTGFVDIDWDEIEIDLKDKHPKICLHGKANKKAKLLKINEWLATWLEYDRHLLVRVLALST